MFNVDKIRATQACCSCGGGTKTAIKAGNLSSLNALPVCEWFGINIFPDMEVHDKVYHGGELFASAFERDTPGFGIPENGWVDMPKGLMCSNAIYVGAGLNLAACKILCEDDDKCGAVAGLLGLNQGGACWLCMCNSDPVAVDEQTYSSVETPTDLLESKNLAPEAIGLTMILVGVLVIGLLSRHRSHRAESRPDTATVGRGIVLDSPINSRVLSGAGYPSFISTILLLNVSIL